MATILDLTHIELDPELLERAPLELCRYHQALPLAREDSRVSVAMVYPHNAAACAMLAELLEAEIVPVQIEAALLQEAFERLSLLFAASPSAEPPQLLLYAPDVQGGALLLRLAQTLADEEKHPYTRLDSPDVPVAAALTTASVSRCRLCLLPMSKPAEWGDLALRSSTSLLMAATDSPRLKHILAILRGHGADMQATPWAAAIAAAEAAGLTLLLLNETTGCDLHALLDPETAVGRHLAAVTRLATAKGIEPTLRIRQGDPIRQIVDEVATQRYDMVALCAESRGEFAAAVLRKLAAPPVGLRALLLCKPSRFSAPLKSVSTTKRRLHRD
ncbi:MAG: hypothetical protein NZ553_16350 [Caldilinea sp.]|nr:hypothetical protein [Caldilinea sp.]MDW8442050.1 hypothetical protein [Caldilineaceae bacterium]